MPPAKPAYPRSDAIKPLAVKEEQLEYGFIGKLQSLKYEYRPDIRDRASLERNFREKFDALNRVNLSDGEFTRMMDEDRHRSGANGRPDPAVAQACPRGARFQA